MVHDLVQGTTQRFGQAVAGQVLRGRIHEDAVLVLVYGEEGHRGVVGYGLIQSLLVRERCFGLLPVGDVLQDTDHARCLGMGHDMAPAGKPANGSVRSDDAKFTLKDAVLLAGCLEVFQYTRAILGMDEIAPAFSGLPYLLHRDSEQLVQPLAPSIAARRDIGFPGPLIRRIHGETQPFLALTKRRFIACALHGNRHLIGHRFHEREIVRRKRRPGTGAERQRPDQAVLCHERMAGIGVNSVRPDKVRPHILDFADAFRDDSVPIARDTSAHRRAQLEPFDAARFFLWDAGVRIQM